MIRLEPYQRQADARGSFLGLTQEARSWGEINLVATAAGAVRGNHFHERTREMFCILSGHVAITVEDVRTGGASTFEVQAGDMLIVEPFELHTFRAITDATWLNFLSQPFDPENPDFHHKPDAAGRADAEPAKEPS